jgi:hypothetical protein
VKFTLTEVSDGGLSIEVEEPQVNYNRLKVVTDWTCDGGQYDVKAEVNGRFDQAKSNLGNLVHELRNALKGNEKFYFPVSCW